MEEKMAPKSWNVRSVWASTDIRFQQSSWPFAVFVMEETRLSLETRFKWDTNWTRKYEEIEYVLMNGKSFFIVAIDGTFGRVIGDWKFVSFVERELLIKKVRIENTNESLKLLLSRRKRERLSHYPIAD